MRSKQIQQTPSTPIYNNLRLFSDYFLKERIRESTSGLWLAESEKILAIVTRDHIRSKMNDFLAQYQDPNEAQTEDEFIKHVLDLLKFERVVQTGIKKHGKTIRPDYTLFQDKKTKSRANRIKAENPTAFYKLASVICEAKYWERPLDNTISNDSKDLQKNQNPHFQIINYLVMSNKDWGILTNGRYWRLYYLRSGQSGSNYYEVDLQRAVRSDRLDDFLYFYLFFRQEAFLKDATGASYLEKILQGSAQYARQIGGKLKEQIFEEIFPLLSAGLIEDRKNRLAVNGETRESLQLIYEATLVLLYRLLFILYAESMDLLPVSEPDYYDYSLTAIKEKVADRMIGNHRLSSVSTDLWNDLKALFTILKRGDPAINVPTYNGGLFEERDEKSHLLETHVIADCYLYRALDLLERDQDDPTTKRFIDYKSLSVRDLGSIYEGLLEFRLEIAQLDMAIIQGKNSSEKYVPLDQAEKQGLKIAKDRKGTLKIVTKGTPFLINDKSERKSTGSYYTPDFIVKYLVKNSLEPVIDQRLEIARKIEEKIKKAIKKQKSLKSPDSIKANRAEIDRLRNASIANIFTIKILDPAMGSGHFLVEAVDLLTKKVVTFLDQYPESPAHNYIRETRNSILECLEQQNVTINRERLKEENIIKRMVLKRSVYGVDLNPMAVELAKLSLWLNAFTIGAPLSFLDHHLKSGNSLVGAVNVSDFIAPSSPKHSMFLIALRSLLMLSNHNDITFDEVKKSADLFKTAKKNLYSYRQQINVLLAQFFSPVGIVGQTMRWADMDDETREQEKQKDPVSYQNFVQSQETAARHRFFHWKIEFPEAFYDARGNETEPGFDVVLGNPPWERIKLQENEFFASHDLEVALAPTAARRKKRIQELKQENTDLWNVYNQAKNRADKTLAFFRKSRDYPLMGRGDMNYYALFVERSLNLTSPKGRFGMVVPSGIATDKTCSYFFRDVVEQKRLVSLIDFENRSAHFQNVHRSFKYSLFILSGRDTPQTEIRSGFFLHDPEDLNEKERLFTLSVEDFALLNPNTKTCPVFRTKKDAQLTKKIYKSSQVLILRQEKTENPWKIKFVRMFDMTNDSRLFSRRDELGKEGFWLSRGNVFKRGETEYLPLYEGKMVQMYDHRAAKVVLNIKNVHRPASPFATTLAEHKNPKYSPLPQFWVPAKEVVSRLTEPTPRWFMSYKNVCSPTNERTFICTILPISGVGNSQPLIFAESFSPCLVCCLYANLCSFPFDFSARQKIGGVNLNFFIVEQLPVFPPETYMKDFQSVNLSEFISQRVLELTYTAYDIQAFAHDLGYSGAPFPWDEERRLHLRCQLDALFFHLYGLSLEEIHYILNTFPIVRRHDEDRFGSFRTLALIEQYFRAYAAGDMEAWVAIA